MTAAPVGRGHHAATCSSGRRRLGASSMPVSSWRACDRTSVDGDDRPGERDAGGHLERARQPVDERLRRPGAADLVRP